MFGHPVFLTLKSPDSWDGPLLNDLCIQEHTSETIDLPMTWACALFVPLNLLFNNNIVRWDYILHFKPLLYQVVRLPLSVSAQNRNSLGFS